MKWETLFSNKRYGSRNLTNQDETRGEYLRDYDRLIFSSQFRRLQNKTQVFPLPGAVFVHNRLTHSLEVASVGRSLGRVVGERLTAIHEKEFNQNTKDFYRFELSDVIQTACIAHDIGNPPFGHSGEDAIRTFFRELPENIRKKIIDQLTENQLADLQWFEGNANAFRILSTTFSRIGLKLTYTTLASIVKYPVISLHGFKKNPTLIAEKKSGYFDTEIPVMESVARELGLISIDSEKQLYARHPFVFLVEAADDICYRIIDLEDAHRLQVISFAEARDLLLPFFVGEPQEKYVSDQMNLISDDKQKLSLLRAMLINLLTNRCAEVFISNQKALLDGHLNAPLIDLIDEKSKQLLKEIDRVSVKKIYNHKSVVEIEIAGFHVIGGLLSQFVEAILDRKSKKSQKLLQLIPKQFDTSEESGLYQNLLSILDFISGMTDIYAVDLYRKITGIQIPSLS
jgi:dGTPase